MLRPMSIEDVLALGPCRTERAIREVAERAGLSDGPHDPREVLRRLRGYVSEGDLRWLLSRYLAKHHPGRVLIASSWRDARKGDAATAEILRGWVARGDHPYNDHEQCARIWYAATLDDIARVMNMTYAEALAVTK